MLASLKNSLSQAERIDILTAFFYFSGFDALMEELKDKYIRILVGKTIDPTRVSDLGSILQDGQNVDLASFANAKMYKLNNTQKKEQYIDSFVELFNNSALSNQFDETNSQKFFKIFVDKIQDGTLQIRFTNDTNHAKAFILTNKPEHSCFGDSKGVVFTGSSNFTYNGLIGQGELNERFSDNTKYDEYNEHFEGLWNNSKAVNIATKDNHQDFVKQLKERLWIYATPTPYDVYVRVLAEQYSYLDNIKIETPNQITSGKFDNYKYQLDAIQLGLDCIDKNNGVIVADVVGLGKSIIASAIARNLNYNKNIVIAPPHLKEQWEEYKGEFGIRGAVVASSGNLENLYNTYINDDSPILYIIDEAHRYRNELSSSYQWLHQLTRSNPNNKVILLTATPYNNRPQDLFALIKLFQTPSRSTITCVDNLGIRFRELIANYNVLEKDGKKNMTPQIKSKLERLSEQLRVLIDPVIIRRSRIDLSEIKEYAEDLDKQGIKFSKVVGPELLQYDLGDIQEMYINTLKKLSNEFSAVRYNPASYLVDPKAFNDKYGHFFEDADITHFQRNLAQFIKRLLVMRFESSKSAFRTTLDNIIHSYHNIKEWWAKGFVPILKRGHLPDFDLDEVQEILNEINDIEPDFDKSKLQNKPLPIPASFFREDFIKEVEHDIKLLESIRDKWFVGSSLGYDPKFERVKEKVEQLLNQDKTKKIVIFSSYADTAIYVKNQLEENRFRVLLYTGSSDKVDRNIVRQNFDASYKDTQKDEYDIIVATDALSEGFNLNRAGIIINYDIPYNPTRVVQRIGRINRINKKMFDEIAIFNLFPSEIGEQVTLIKGISQLKMLLINNIVGSDTRTLSPDETLESYFRKQIDDIDNSSSEKAWDNEFKNEWNDIKHNAEQLKKSYALPIRSRLLRKNCKEELAIAFAKRGNHSIFARCIGNNEQVELSSPESVLKYFKAHYQEQSYATDQSLDQKFIALRDEITKPYPKIKLDKRKGDSIKKLDKLLELYPQESDYIQDLLEIIKTYDDLSDGELKFLANIKIKKDNLREILDEIKQTIPNSYINNIREKVQSIDSQTEIIMFTEDLRMN